jgi:hypothetical protein
MTFISEGCVASASSVTLVDLRWLPGVLTNRITGALLGCSSGGGVVYTATAAARSSERIGHRLAVRWGEVKEQERPRDNSQSVQRTNEQVKVMDDWVGGDEAGAVWGVAGRGISSLRSLTPSLLGLSLNHVFTLLTHCTLTQTTQRCHNGVSLSCVVPGPGASKTPPQAIEFVPTRTGEAVV